MLLLTVAAVLSTSAQIVGLGGQVGTDPPPPPSTVAVVEQAPWRAFDDPPAGAPRTRPPTSPGALAACDEVVDEGTGASRCLGALGSAPPAAVHGAPAAVDDTGEAAASLAAALAPRLDARRTEAWWDALPPDRRDLLVDALPGVVGNLEGLPYADRAAANERQLASVLGATAARLGTDRERDDDAARLAMLQQVLRAVQDRSSGWADRSLVAFDPVLPGRAAVSVGDLDAAEDVTVLVPGMLFTVTGQLVDWSETAGHVQQEEATWVQRLDPGDGPGAGTAVVAWMGYRTPDLTNFATLDLARTGAGQLEDALLGLDASRADAPARVTVVAHSYGSTTSTLALSSGRIAVDSLVVLGSPGSVVGRASDLAVRHADVYAAAGSFDPVAGSAFFGADPAVAAFGGVVLHTGGTVDPVTRVRLGAALGHNDYLLPGTETVRDIALVALGRGDLVGRPSTAPTGPDQPRPGPPGLTLVRPQELWPRD
ncbi:alpha/beta hydrolase [Frigoribacterium salinisoli]